MSLWRKVLSRLLPPMLVSALLGMAAVPAVAGSKTYLSLWQRCTATGGAASLATERPAILYPVSGDTKTRRYVSCVDGDSGWSDDKPGYFNGCRAFDVASYSVNCFGGTVSGPAFFAGFPQQMKANKLALKGNTLYVALRPSMMVVPTQPDELQSALDAATRLSPLAPGYAPLPPEGSMRSIAWDDARGIPLIRVDAPTDVPAAPALAPAPGWVKVLSQPIFLIPVLGLLLAYGVIAGFGFHKEGQEDASRLPLAGLTLAALWGVVMAGDAANLPDQAVARFNQQVAGMRAELAAIERDRGELRSIVAANGNLVPLTEQAMQRVNALTRERPIRAPQQPTADPAFWATVYLVPALLLVLSFGLRFVVGFHYLFVPHPAGKAIEPALRSSDLIHTRHGKEFAAAVTPDPAEVANPPQAYRSWNFAAKARAYTQRLREDEELARAAKERDIARAAQKEAEERLRAARSKLPWWKRLFWR